jgi:hypothetical protein
MTVEILENGLKRGKLKIENKQRQPLQIRKKEFQRQQRNTMIVVIIGKKVIEELVVESLRKQIRNLIDTESQTIKQIELQIRESRKQRLLFEKDEYH